MSTSSTFPTRTVLITGATGSQGGAVLSEFLQSSVFSPSSIRILTRNPDSSKAKAIASQGIQVFKGDLAQPETLQSALVGAKSAFLVTDYSGPAGTKGETEQGKAFVDACKAAGVEHLVFTSGDGAERSSGVPHFDSKWLLEEHLRASGMPYTTLRPVAYMENLPTTSGIVRYMVLGLFGAALGGKKLQWIAVKDIGWFGARALENPEEWKGREIALAGDDLSVKDIVDAFARVQGVTPWQAPVPGFATSFIPGGLGKMMRWFYTSGYTVDIPAVKKIHPGLMNFEQWLRSKQPSAN